MDRDARKLFPMKPVAVAVCSLLFTGTPLLQAQELDSSATAVTPVSKETDDVEQILVFARKRGEQEKDVPVSMSAMSSNELAEAGVTDITSMFQLMPGVENNADGSRIANKPAIRGVGSTENSSIRAKVTTFIDGIPDSFLPTLK